MAPLPLRARTRVSLVLRNGQARGRRRAEMTASPKDELKYKKNAAASHHPRFSTRRSDACGAPRSPLCGRHVYAAVFSASVLALRLAASPDQ